MDRRIRYICLHFQIRATLHVTYTNVVKFYSVERCPARGSVRDIFLHTFEQILRRSKISV